MMNFMEMENLQLKMDAILQDNFLIALFTENEFFMIKMELLYLMENFLKLYFKKKEKKYIKM